MSENWGGLVGLDPWTLKVLAMEGQWMTTVWNTHRIHLTWSKLLKAKMRDNWVKGQDNSELPLKLIHLVTRWFQKDIWDSGIIAFNCNTEKAKRDNYSSHRQYNSLTVLLAHFLKHVSPSGLSMKKIWYSGRDRKMYARLGPPFAACFLQSFHVFLTLGENNSLILTTLMATLRSKVSSKISNCHERVRAPSEFVNTCYSGVNKNCAWAEDAGLEGSMSDTCQFCYSPAAEVLTRLFTSLIILCKYRSRNEISQQ